MKSNKAKTEQFAFYSMEIGAERYRERVESCCVKTYASFANKRKGKNSRENYISRRKELGRKYAHDSYG